MPDFLKITYNTVLMPKNLQKEYLKQALIILLIVVAVFGLSFWARKQVQDQVQTDLREDVFTPVDGTQTRPERETVAYYWEAEDLVAQQIFKALQIRRVETTQIILNNVEQNLQFNRNKAAVHFYLAAAHEQLGRPERASGFYAALMQNFNNRNIVLNAFNAELLSGEKSTRYSVAIQEEAALRLCRLYADPSFLGTAEPLELFLFLRDSQNTFGPESSPGFLYADLAVLAQNNPKRLPSSEEYCAQRLRPAEEFLQKFLEQVSSADSLESIYSSGMTTESTRRTLSAEFNRLRVLGLSGAPTLTLESIHKDRDDYLYVFIYNEAELRFTLRDNLYGALIIERIQK